MTETEHICKLCSKPVILNRDRAVSCFEGMHWLCFHIIFEHTGDTDAPCDDIDCPMLSDAAKTERLAQWV